MAHSRSLEWHNLDGLRSMLCDPAGVRYLTVAALMDDRKEAQLQRLAVDESEDLFASVTYQLGEFVPAGGLPKGGRLRFRVRMWGRGGRPIRGVVVRLQARGSVPRRGRSSRPKRKSRSPQLARCRGCRTSGEEIAQLRQELEQSKSDRRLLQDALTATRRKLERTSSLSPPSNCPRVTP